MLAFSCFSLNILIYGDEVFIFWHLLQFWFVKFPFLSSTLVNHRKLSLIAEDTYCNSKLIRLVIFGFAISPNSRPVSTGKLLTISF